MPAVMLSSAPQVAAKIIDRVIEVSNGLMLPDSAVSLIAQFGGAARSIGQAMYWWL